MGTIMSALGELRRWPLLSSERRSNVYDKDDDSIGT
jgi:hypothetical protein